MFDYQVDDAGIATLSWNMPGRAVNVMNGESIEAFGKLVGEAVEDGKVRGGIITSSKPGFAAGADLEAILKLKREEVAAQIREMHRILRVIETGGKPFVAAINGTAVGGGYEICLACHHRIVAADSNAEIGLPEVGLGLLPGAGGTQRLPRLIGIRNALPFLLEGKRLRPREAMEAGLVDAVVPGADLLASAKAWLLSRTEKPVQPWDTKGFRIPGGAPISPTGMETFGAATAMLRAKTMGLYPAPVDILSCVFEGCSVDIDTGLKIEQRYFLHLFGMPQVRNLVRLFFSRGELNKLAARPKDVPPQDYTKIGILGAGMMGSGIAYVCADAGLDVVLLDETLEKAEQGKGYSAKLLDKKVAAGGLNAEARDRFLARIRPATDYADLKGCELVIEAVFESRDIKADVTRKTAAALGPNVPFASNTSTLPITGLAEAWPRPENFIGLHFFSPVDKMALLEIIRGKKTSDECLARAMDFARRIRKTPIVVNDSRGFYTSRVFGTYVSEGLAMLKEGIAPALIENAGRMAGMPVGPLVLADEISLDLMQHVRKQTKADLGDSYRPHPGEEVAEVMVAQYGRLGKKAGKGFYDYPAGGKKRLWPGLKERFPARADQPEVAELIKRFLYVQSVESVRCMEEGVITDPRDADVGSILGWSFCPAMGGVISHIETVGMARFTEECRKLETAYGDRFAAPGLLWKMAAKGESFYG